MFFSGDLASVARVLIYFTRLFCSQAPASPCKVSVSVFRTASLDFSESRETVQQ